MKLKNTRKFANKEELIRKLKAALNRPNWTDVFCVDEEGDKRTYSNSEEGLAYFQECYTNGEGCLVMGEEELLAWLRSFMLEHVEEIADWLLDYSCSRTNDNLKIWVPTDAEGYARNKYAKGGRVPIDWMLFKARTTGTDSPFGFLVTSFDPYNMAMYETYHAKDFNYYPNQEKANDYRGFASAEELETKIIEILDGPHWKDIFCTDEEGTSLTYKKSEDLITRLAGTGVGYFCGNKEMHFAYLRHFFRGVAGRLADWLFHCSQDGEIFVSSNYSVLRGYAYDSEQKRTKTDFVELVIRTHSETPFGFYVADFAPYSRAIREESEMRSFGPGTTISEADESARLARKEELTIKMREVLSGSDWKKSFLHLNSSSIPSVRDGFAWRYRLYGFGKINKISLLAPLLRTLLYAKAPEIAEWLVAAERKEWLALSIPIPHVGYVYEADGRRIETDEFAVWLSLHPLEMPFDFFVVLAYPSHRERTEAYMKRTKSVYEKIYEDARSEILD